MDPATMPHRDGLDALRRVNPRNDPGFDASAAAMAHHTRQAVAAAAVGASGGAGPSGLGRGEAGPNRRGRYLLALLIVVGAVIATLLLVGTAMISVPRSSRSQPSPGATTGGPGPSQPGASSTTQTNPAGPGAPATGSVPAAAPSALPATAASPPSPTAASTGATTSRGQKGSTTGPSVTAAAPTATPAPITTTTASPPSSTAASAAVPTCTLSPTASGPATHQSVSVQDLGSGLASISNVAVTNGTVSVPRFAPGTRTAVIVVATKTDATKPTVWSFDATDLAGHTTHCA